MNDPVMPQKAPYAVEVEAGKDYFWCSCGRSAVQPFCDGSHKGTGFVPLKFTPETSGIVHLCGCKHSNRPPYCDGTHSKL